METEKMVRLASNRAFKICSPGLVTCPKYMIPGGILEPLCASGLIIEVSEQRRVGLLFAFILATGIICFEFQPTTYRETDK